MQFWNQHKMLHTYAKFVCISLIKSYRKAAGVFREQVVFISAMHCIVVTEQRISTSEIGNANKRRACPFWHGCQCRSGVDRGETSFRAYILTSGNGKTPVTAMPTCTADCSKLAPHVLLSAKHNKALQREGLDEHGPRRRFNRTCVVEEARR